MIERAYQLGEALGLAVWGMDEAGPYTTTPYPGTSWQVQTHPKRYPHEYPRDGTAKMLTLFHPATGRVRMKGVTSATNIVLHGWLKTELTDILADLPEPTPVSDEQANRVFWESWREGVSVKPTLLSADLPPLRMLLILDNLAGHHTPELVLWLFRHGILPLYTPLGGSWLNMTESIQRILKRRALDGQYPATPQHIITWLEATARGWNAHPTPFVWAGKRQQRRHRAFARRHRLGGSAAVTKRPLRFRFIPSTQECRCA
jgi:hypothetical protein